MIKKNIRVLFKNYKLWIVDLSYVVLADQRRC